VQEVVDLSNAEVDPTQFYAALLEKSISALAAIGGGVWTFEEGAGFKLEYQVNLKQTGLLESTEAMNQHSRLLGRLAKRGEAPRSSTPPRARHRPFDLSVGATYARERVAHVVPSNGRLLTRLTHG
jgi:hypothetical protein